MNGHELQLPRWVAHVTLRSGSCHRREVQAADQKAAIKQVFQACPQAIATSCQLDRLQARGVPA